LILLLFVYVVHFILSYLILFIIESYSRGRHNKFIDDDDYDDEEEEAITPSYAID